MALIERRHALQPFGVEISIDQQEAFTQDGQRALRALFDEEALLVIRGLQLTMAEQRELCLTFGHIPDSQFENFYVSNRRADGFLGSKELQWHNDVPYLPSPYRVAALHAVEVDPDATSTRFVSGIRAYAALPEPVQARLKGMNALQVRQRVSERANRLEDLLPGDICTVHAVVGAHEGSGRPYLFVNENMTAAVIGLTRDESDALLIELYGHLYAEAEVYEHRWQPGDLVVWDNLAIQHARGLVGEGARTLQRVTCTQFTYAQQYPADIIISQELNTATLMGVAAAA